MRTEVEKSSEATLDIYALGFKPYVEVWEFQKKLQADLIQGIGRDAIVLCQHEPTITLGRSASKDNILASRELLDSKGIAVHEIERGGDVTFHGPGQIVGYPILNLTHHKKDVSWYMRALEEVLLRTLNDYGIAAQRIVGRTGVWTLSTENDKEKQLGPRKIASLGIRISRWCTLHGFSLNVLPCKEGFELINPCGFKDISVTSMTEERLAPLDLAKVEMSIIRHFIEVFGFHGS